MYENSFVVVGTITTVERIGERVRITMGGPGPAKSDACIEVNDPETATIIMHPTRGFRPGDVISASGHLKLDPTTQQNVAIAVRGGIARVAAAAPAAKAASSPAPAPTTHPSPSAPVPQQAEAQPAPPLAAPGNQTKPTRMFGGAAPSAKPAPTAPPGRPDALPPGFPNLADTEFPDLPF